MASISDKMVAHCYNCSDEIEKNEAARDGCGYLCVSCASEEWADWTYEAEEGKCGCCNKKRLVCETDGGNYLTVCFFCFEKERKNRLDKNGMVCCDECGVNMPLKNAIPDGDSGDYMCDYCYLVDNGMDPRGDGMYTGLRGEWIHSDVG